MQSLLLEWMLYDFYFIFLICKDVTEYKYHLENSPFVLNFYFKFNVYLIFYSKI